MLPVLAAVSAVSQIAQLVPSFLKMFGEDQPPTIVTRAAEIAQSITGALNPEDALKKLQEDSELLAKFRDAAEARAADIMKAHLQDIQSARSRDVEIQKIKGGNSRADILAGLAVLTVIACLSVVVMVSDIDDFAKGVITMICGRALGWVEQVFSFDFGSTRSNKVKDETINKLSKDNG